MISPGPGRPDDAGVSLDIIRELSPELPILGVCLGMQAIAEILGGELYNQDEVKQEGEVGLNIVPYGSVAAAGYGFFGLSAGDQATVIVPVLLPLAAIFYVISRGRRKKKGEA